ncbi:MAG: hypothetical protein A2020_15230 [Lentisphaerae bacterium GWF2_45_14]|nr:MAG: hypothetical protein A2020_15230 [Lentisphaerae bacterium GWF2_45_14]
MRIFNLAASIFSAAFLLLSTSCSDQNRNEQNHPYFSKAVRLNSEGKYEESVKYFEKYLRIYPESTKAHYELAVVYDEGLNMPIDAIYHYRQYLKFAPDSQDRAYIKDSLAGAEKKFYTQMRKKYMGAPAESFSPSPVLVQPQVSAKSEPSKVEGEVAARTSVEKAEPPAKKYPEFYTVEKGDTLARISLKIYGSSKYYRAIYDVNRESLASETSLRIGQRLRIPPIN